MRGNLTGIFGPGGFDSRLQPEYESPPEQRFSDELANFGIVLKDTLRTGEIVRCPMRDQKKGKLNGWYIYFGTDYSSGIAGGVYGDWRYAGESHYWSSISDRDMTPQQRQAYELSVKAAQQKQAAERKARQDESAAEAQQILKDAPLAIAHDYLTRKQVKPYGVHASEGALLVPMRDVSGEVRSLQRIYPNGDKRFLAGGQVTGCFHLIGSTLTEPTYVCEGYATGATIHQLTNKAVVVAFNSGNLEPTVKALREAGNQHQLIVCADNDRQTEGNPGVTAANRAAGEFLGVSVVAPEFNGTEGTDFNDLHISEGAAAVMRCLSLSTEKHHAKDLLLPLTGLTAQAPSWLVKGVLPRTGLGVLFGPSGGGKSFAALDMALCVASGRDWHGRRIKAPGSVIYVCGEGHQGVLNRILAWEKHTGIPVAGLPMRITRKPVRFLDAQAVSELMVAIEEHNAELGGVDLLQIDTLARNFGDGDENTTKDMGRFIDNLTDLQGRLDCNAMIIHHTGLGADDRARGSSALRAALDYEIQHKVLPTENDEPTQFSLIGKKMKDGSHMTDAHFSLEFVPLGIDEDGDEFGSCVPVSMAADKVASEATADALMEGARERIVLSVLREMRAKILANKPDIERVIIEQKPFYEAIKARGIPQNKTSTMRAICVAKGLLLPLTGATYEVTELVEKQ
jgi:putative DNA primase/helicase